MSLVDLLRRIRCDTDSVPTNGQGVNAFKDDAQKETGGPKAPRIPSSANRQFACLSREMTALDDEAGAGTLSMKIDVRPINAGDGGLA